MPVLLNIGHAIITLAKTKRHQAPSSWAKHTDCGQQFRCHIELPLCNTANVKSTDCAFSSSPWKLPKCVSILNGNLIIRQYIKNEHMLPRYVGTNEYRSPAIGAPVMFPLLSSGSLDLTSFVAEPFVAEPPLYDEHLHTEHKKTSTTWQRYCHEQNSVETNNMTLTSWDKKRAINIISWKKKALRWQWLETVLAEMFERVGSRW